MFIRTQTHYLKELRKDALRLADRERLARQASKNPSCPEHWLATLGAWMIAWGQRLQAQYGPVVRTAPALRSSK